MNKWNDFRDWLTRWHKAALDEADDADTYSRSTAAFARAHALRMVRAELEQRGLWDAPVWTSAWPADEGMYWFWGTTGHEVLELEVVRIVKVGNEFWGNMSGDLLREGYAAGVWQRMVTPDLPEQER